MADLKSCTSLEQYTAIEEIEPYAEGRVKFPLRPTEVSSAAAPSCTPCLCGSPGCNVDIIITLKA